MFFVVRLVVFYISVTLSMYEYVGVKSLIFVPIVQRSAIYLQFDYNRKVVFFCYFCTCIHEITS